jgi:hypothetical protein
MEVCGGEHSEGKMVGREKEGRVGVKEWREEEGRGKGKREGKERKQERGVRPPV